MAKRRPTLASRRGRDLMHHVFGEGARPKVFREGRNRIRLVVTSSEPDGRRDDELYRRFEHEDDEYQRRQEGPIVVGMNFGRWARLRGVHPRMHDSIYRHRGVWSLIESGRLDANKVLGFLDISLHGGEPGISQIQLHGDLRGGGLGRKWHDETLLPFLRKKGFRYVIVTPASSRGNRLDRYWGDLGYVPVRESKYREDLRRNGHSLNDFVYELR